MAFKHGTAAKVYLTNLDISCYLESVGLTLERDMVDIRVLCAGAVKRIIGWKGATLDLEGVYDAASHEAEIWDLIDTAEEGVAVVLFGGEALGAPGYMTEVLVSSEQISAGNDAIKMPSQAFGLGTIRRGVILHAMEEETTSGDGDSLDQSASSLNGGAAYLVVPAIGAGATLEVKVQDSDDEILWDDLIVFTVDGADGPVGSLAEAAGAVGQYIRTVWTLGGVGEATFFVGWARD